MAFLKMFLITVFIVYGFVGISQSKMPVPMMEETAINTEIGNILSYIPQDLRNTQLQFVSENTFFSVTDNGKLIVKQSIDLETLCLQHKLCCGLPICTISVNILINNNDRGIVANVELQIRILDKNDHQPKFPTSEQRLLISEFTQIGTLISLTPATDNDATTDNRIQSYRLQEASGSFTLDLTHLPSISLRVMKPLDYEEKTKFEGTIEACDPEVCSKQKLIINIKDENDNPPIFLQESYNITIKEDTTVGRSIARIRAFDKDSGKFGEIRFFITVDSDMDLKSTFVIDVRSGDIQLRQKLSTNTRDFYQFRVLAKDSDPINSKQAMCSVTIKIVDVNDHAPEIKVLPNIGSLNISENSSPRHITTLKIIDDDQGLNAKVMCRLDPNSEGLFELKHSTGNVYSLKTLRQFDHESEQKIEATVICRDHGEPSLETVKTISVNIIDINEYKPYFKPNDQAGFYRSSLLENSQAGTKVLTVTAYDKDKSAILRYQIDNYGSEYFQIDSVTGEITCTNKELDRERTPFVSFIVQVTDSIIDPKTTNVQVNITVLDANDNSPVFPLHLPPFSVIENTPPTRLTGQLTARDEDQGDNAIIRFSLLHTWNGHTMQRHESLFHVNPSGYIETLTKLDREKCDYYILEVSASDTARPPQLPLATKVNLTVRVLDENDNAPTWTYPDLNVYNISDSMKPGDHLIQLRAQDIDLGQSGKVRFDIVSQYRQEMGPSKIGGNSAQYFTLNSSSGQLWISQLLHAGTVVILFRASDYGHPPRSSDIKFLINISGDDSSNLNMTIIAVMITVTAVISLFLIVAIICVRRKPPKYHSPTSSILTKDQPVPDWIGLHPSDESLVAYQPGNKSPYISASTMRPASVVPTNDGALQMHTYTPNCLSYEPIDGDSGDSGKGPSEEGSNSQHPNQEGTNYYSLRQPVRGTYRPCVPIPASPARSTCHCYVLPEDSIIQPGSYPVYSQGMDNISLMSTLPPGYSSYSSFSLPRNQYPMTRQRINANNPGTKFPQYIHNESGSMTPTQITAANSNQAEYPRVYSRLTPMHIRRISERDADGVTSQTDDRASSLVTSTTSASSSTKTVLFNGLPVSLEASAISTTSSPSYADSVDA